MPDRLYSIITMDKDHLINLHRLAETASGRFQTALRDGTPDAELGRCAREWADAEIRLAQYREEQLSLHPGRSLWDAPSD